MTVYVDIDDAEAPLLRHSDPGDQALHAPRCPRLTFSKEQERRKRIGLVCSASGRVARFLSCMLGAHS